MLSVRPAVSVTALFYGGRGLSESSTILPVAPVLSVRSAVSVTALFYGGRELSESSTILPVAPVQSVLPAVSVTALFCGGRGLSESSTPLLSTSYLHNKMSRIMRKPVFEVFKLLFRKSWAK